jgi:hypothetical protein
MSLADSLTLKLRIYCEEAGINNVPAGFADFIASPALGRHGVGFLRALSKEADLWIREFLTWEEQDQMVCKMRIGGVPETELPNTERTRILRRLLRLKRLPRDSEAEVMRRAVSEWQGLSLSAAELSALQEAVRDLPNT